MQINFPDAPTLGEQFTAATGATYEWSGVFWFAVVAATGSGATVLQTDAELLGEPTAPTPPLDDDSERLVTTAWVKRASLADDALLLKNFFAKGDATQLSSGEWVLGPNGNPTAAINQWIDACILTKRWGRADGGDYLIPTGELIWKIDNVDGLHLFGERADTRFITADPRQGKNMWRFGSHLVGRTYVDPDKSTVRLAQATRSGSKIVRFNDTSALRKGFTVVFADQTQKVYYHSGADFVGGTLGQSTKIKRIIDGQFVELDGITEFDYNVGTWIGYLFNPVKSVTIRAMHFAYDPVKSFAGSVCSSLAINGYDKLDIEDITISDAMSRALSFYNGMDIELHGVRFNGATDDCGVMNFQHWCNGGHVSDITQIGGIHAVGFGGNAKFTGPANMQFRDFTTRDAFAPINGHWNMRDISFDRMRCIGSARGWDVDENPNTDNPSEGGAAITMRGYRGIRVTNSYVARYARGFMAFSGTDQTFLNNVAEQCGRGILGHECDRLRIDGFIAKDCRLYAADVVVNAGPPQGFPRFTNMVFKDIHSIGSPPQFADFRLQLGGSTPVSELRRLGWSFGPMTRNGQQAVCIGVGGAAAMFPSDWLPSAGTEPADQVVGPLVATEVVLGAAGATVADVSGVTVSYQPNSRLQLGGGTFASPASLKVLTTQLVGLIISPLIKLGQTTAGSARVQNIGPGGTSGGIVQGQTISDSLGAFPAGTTVRQTTAIAGDTNGDDPDPTLAFVITNIDAAAVEWATGQTITDLNGDIPPGTVVEAVGSPLANSITLSQAAIRSTPGNALSIGSTSDYDVVMSAPATLSTPPGTAHSFTFNKSTGYGVGDVITLNGGTFVSAATRARATVASILAGGALDTVTISLPGAYLANASYFTQSSVVNSIGGASLGTGARFDNLIFAPLTVAPFKTGDYTLGATPANPVGHEGLFVGDTINDANVTGTRAIGSAIVSNVRTMKPALVTLPPSYVGMAVTGPGIAAGATIVSIAANSMTLSAPATSAVSNGRLTIRLTTDAAIAAVVDTTFAGRVVNVVPDPVSSALIGQRISDSDTDIADDATVSQVKAGQITLSRAVTGATLGNAIRTRSPNAGAGALFNVQWDNCVDMSNVPKVGVDIVDTPPPSTLNTLAYFGSAPGLWRIVRFSRAIRLLHDPARLNLNRGGGNIDTEIGDIGVFLADAAGVYNLLSWASNVLQTLLSPRITFPTAPSTGLLGWTDGTRQLRTRPDGAVRGFLSPNTRLHRASGRDNVATPAGDTLAVVGTPTAIVAAATNFYTRQARTSLLSAAGAGRDADWELPLTVYPDDAGSFLVRWSWDVYPANAPAMFVGLKPTGPLVNLNPTNLQNCFGVGFNGGNVANAHTTLHRMIRATAGSGGGLDYGASFPINTSAADLYEVQGWWTANMTRLWLAILRTNALGQTFTVSEVLTPGTPASIVAPAPLTPLRLGLWASSQTAGVAAIQPVLHELILET